MDYWWDILGGLVGMGFGLRSVICHKREAEKTAAWNSQVNSFLQRRRFLRWLVDKEPLSISALDRMYFWGGFLILLVALSFLIRGIRGLLGQ